MEGHEANRIDLESAEIEKIRVETRKLEAEVDHLKKPWFVSPNWITAILTGALALIGTSLNCASADLKLQSAQLQLAQIADRRTKLEADSTRLAATIDELETQALDAKVLVARSQAKAESLTSLMVKLVAIGQELEPSPKANELRRTAVAARDAVNDLSDLAEKSRTTSEKSSAVIAGLRPGIAIWYSVSTQKPLAMALRNHLDGAGLQVSEMKESNPSSLPAKTQVIYFFKQDSRTASAVADGLRRMNFDTWRIRYLPSEAAGTQAGSLEVRLGQAASGDPPSGHP